MPGGSVHTVSGTGDVTGGLALAVQHTVPLDHYRLTSTLYIWIRNFHYTFNIKVSSHRPESHNIMNESTSNNTTIDNTVIPEPMDDRELQQL
mgnify:FL=1